MYDSEGLLEALPEEEKGKDIASFKVLFISQQLLTGGKNKILGLFCQLYVSSFFWCGASCFPSGVSSSRLLYDNCTHLQFAQTE